MGNNVSFCIFLCLQATGWSGPLIRCKKRCPSPWFLAATEIPCWCQWINSSLKARSLTHMHPSPRIWKARQESVATWQRYSQCCEDLVIVYVLFIHCRTSRTVLFSVLIQALSHLVYPLAYPRSLKIHFFFSLFNTLRHYVYLVWAPHLYRPTSAWWLMWSVIFIFHRNPCYPF